MAEDWEDMSVNRVIGVPDTFPLGGVGRHVEVNGVFDCERTMIGVLPRVDPTLLLKPIPRGCLGLRKIKDLDAIRIHCVVGGTKGLISLLPVFGSVSSDPRSTLRTLPVSNEASL
jgi:hypothetical protein